MAPTKPSRRLNFAVRSQGLQDYYNITDPAVIQQRAEKDTPVREVTADWAMGTDPKVHIAKIHELFDIDSRVSIVNIHAGQADQTQVIDFYGRYVLPKLGLPA